MLMMTVFVDGIRFMDHGRSLDSLVLSSIPSGVSVSKYWGIIGEFVVRDLICCKNWSMWCGSIECEEMHRSEILSYIKCVIEHPVYYWTCEDFSVEWLVDKWRLCTLIVFRGWITSDDYDLLTADNKHWLDSYRYVPYDGMRLCKDYCGRVMELYATDFTYKEMTSLIRSWRDSLELYLLTLIRVL